MNIRINFEDFIKEILKYMVENNLLIIGGETVSAEPDNARNKKKENHPAARRFNRK